MIMYHFYARLQIEFGLSFASSTVSDKKSQCFLSVDLGELVDFEFEVFDVSEAVSHTIEPADYVIEALHTGIAEMFEGPVAGNIFNSVSDVFAMVFSSGTSVSSASLHHR